MQTATLYRYRWKFIRIGLILGFFAIAKISQSHAQSVPPSAPPTGARLFTQQCAACHSMKPGEIRVGPSLAGIVGKTAGKQPGFGYSPALKRSPMKWNAVNLDRWLADSNAAVPGSVMNYRQADATKRQALVTYLTTGK
ncbi:c-type cytochrome [Sphingomonadaceae bacterium G21617-S1]|jgi:cytochrome c|uniref:Cytochrome c domain-containing protein n=1 Tax=Sphingobium yanoikuyae TaxID=13690 RepID=A0A430BRL8_SPHYA|nr:c-type cytochrome [Sphingobium yanoikuyae]MCZ4344285.1 c-type cytochrome [Sphingomonadaceae bacterium G21617-S1]RSU55317.1 hypothetical protein DAH51_17390 [Sphingobium yanoikuyae]